MFTDLRKLIVSHELVVNFALREIKAKYKQALLGVSWALLQPLATMIIMTIVFSYFARIPSDGVPYPLFLFTALLPWTFFSGALSRGASSLVNLRGLITKIYFPRESLVVAALAAAFVDFAITALIYIGLLVYYGVAPDLYWLMVVPIMCIQILFTLGIVLFLAPLNVFYRDVGQMIPLVLQIWMYASPIMYPLRIVPERVRPVYFLNPMVCITDSYRRVILHGQSLDYVHLGATFILSVLLVIAGYAYFKRVEMKFADIA